MQTNLIGRHVQWHTQLSPNSDRVPHRGEVAAVSYDTNSANFVLFVNEDGKLVRVVGTVETLPQIHDELGPLNPAHGQDWERIGAICSAGVRSMWMRLNRIDKTAVTDHATNIESIELRGGRNGDDDYLLITRDNPLFAELLTMFCTARFAVNT